MHLKDEMWYLSHFKVLGEILALSILKIVVKKSYYSAQL